jgi:uncharacterized glyoxalase superfamily protein PhnB
MPRIDRVIPLLVYRDIAAAHDFLVRVFGFESGIIERSPDGQVVHGEVQAGRTTIWLHRASVAQGLDTGTSSDSGLVIHVDDVDAHFEHARAAGVQVEKEPVDQPYGQREYGVRDLEGHRWWFATPLNVFKEPE